MPWSNWRVSWHRRVSLASSGMAMSSQSFTKTSRRTLEWSTIHKHALYKNEEGSGTGASLRDGRPGTHADIVWPRRKGQHTPEEWSHSAAGRCDFGPGGCGTALAGAGSGPESALQRRCNCSD